MCKKQQVTSKWHKVKIEESNIKQKNNNPTIWQHKSGSIQINNAHTSQIITLYIYLPAAADGGGGNQRTTKERLLKNRKIDENYKKKAKGYKIVKNKMQ